MITVQRRRKYGHVLQRSRDADLSEPLLGRVRRGHLVRRSDEAAAQWSVPAEVPLTAGEERLAREREWKPVLVLKMWWIAVI